MSDRGDAIASSRFEALLLSAMARRLVLVKSKDAEGKEHHVLGYLCPGHQGYAPDVHVVHPIAIIPDQALIVPLVGVSLTPEAVLVDDEIYNEADETAPRATVNDVGRA